MKPSDEKSAQELELEELRAYKSRQESLRVRELEDQRLAGNKRARQEALDFCQEQVFAGILPPHFRDRLADEIDATPAAFSDAEGLRISFAWVRDFITALQPQLKTGEMAHAPDRERTFADEGENPSEMLSRLAATRMVEMNLSYGQAAEYVLKTNPALARAYRDYTLNPLNGD